MRNTINDVRLDNNEKIALQHALEDVNETVYLFGSRIDTSKKGGDIDILVFSKADPLDTARNISRKFFAKCEEKIDVVVFDPENLSPENQAFLRTIQMIRIQ